MSSTNNHVVSGSNALEVITSSGKKKEAKIVGKDSVTDLAVIKVNSSDINKVATFGDSSAIRLVKRRSRLDHHLVQSTQRH